MVATVDTTEARPDLAAEFVRWERWLWVLARRYANGFGVDHDEVFAEAAFEFVRRWSRFDPERAGFSTWAKIVVRIAARRVRSRLGRSVHAIIASTLPSRDRGGQVLNAIEFQPDRGAPEPAEQAEQRERQSRIRAAVAGLTERQRELLHRRHQADPDELLGHWSERERAELRETEAELRNLLVGLACDE